MRYVESLVYQARSRTSPPSMAARMVAMKAATDNAGNADRRTASWSTTRRARPRSRRNFRRSSAARPRSDAIQGATSWLQHAPTGQDCPDHRRRRRRRIPARVDAEGVRRAEAGRTSDLTLEVQQQLGDGVVRTIALGSSDGLRRGLTVDNTGAPITVPVGKATLGRIMDVLGNPIDERGPVDADGARCRSTARRRRTTSRPASQDLLETGIKVIDLIVPVRQGRQGRPVRRRRRRQDRQHARADQQHRQAALRACRCSPASASAPARATTSITR